MKALISEMYYPDDQYVRQEVTGEDGLPVIGDNGKPLTKRVLRDGAKGYSIRPLKSIQLTEVFTLGTASSSGFAFNLQVILRLLRYGLDCENIAEAIDEMPSSHHALVSRAIFEKSKLMDEERKNS